MNHPLRIIIIALAATMASACFSTQGNRPGTPQSSPGAGQDRGGAFDDANSFADASTKQDGAQPSNGIVNNNGSLGPSRRPADGSGAESIPQLLARTRSELKSEKERADRAEENYTKTQRQIDDLQKELKAIQNEIETTRSERDRLQAKVRDLQERLVTAALRVVESEKETIETKIQLEKSLKLAADYGLVIDVDEISRSVAVKSSTASRPANVKKDGNTKNDETRKPEAGDEAPVKTDDPANHAPATGTQAGHGGKS